MLLEINGYRDSRIIDRTFTNTFTTTKPSVISVRRNFYISVLSSHSDTTGSPYINVTDYTKTTVTVKIIHFMSTKTTATHLAR